jgi:hypothetical protein
MNLLKQSIFPLSLAFVWRFLIPLRFIRNDKSCKMRKEAETILREELFLLPHSHLNKICHSEAANWRARNLTID